MAHTAPKTAAAFKKYTAQKASIVTSSTATSTTITRNGKTEKWVKPGAKWQLVSRT